eukprot:6425058-Alexandrium_andersonii.AAC.1
MALSAVDGERSLSPLSERVHHLRCEHPRLQTFCSLRVALFSAIGHAARPWQCEQTSERSLGATVSEWVVNGVATKEWPPRDDGHHRH